VAVKSVFLLVGWVSSGSSWGCLRWKVFDLKIVTSNNDGERGWRQEAGNQVFDHILVVILKSLAEQNGQQKMLQISVESFFKSNIKGIFSECPINEKYSRWRNGSCFFQMENTTQSIVSNS